jgi:nucleotide-binding universal stress UspA family protein
MSTDAGTRHAPILAAFSPATAAKEPVAFGLAARRLTGAPLVVIAVKHGGLVPHAAIGDPVDGDATLEHLRHGLDRRLLEDVEIAVYEDRTAARGIARAVDELRPELVVLGSSGRGRIGAALLGTTAERVLHASACPVAVVPNGYAPPAEGVRVVGAAYVPMATGREALRAAAVLAWAGGARLRAITVADSERTAARTDLAEAAAELAGGVAPTLDVRVGDPADELVAASRELDLLVMGSRALGPRRAVLLGSVSRKVLDRAACPVLVLPAGVTEQRDALLADAVARATRQG